MAYMTIRWHNYMTTTTTTCTHSGVMKEWNQPKTCPRTCFGMLVHFFLSCLTTLFLMNVSYAYTDIIMAIWLYKYTNTWLHDDYITHDMAAPITATTGEGEGDDRERPWDAMTGRRLAMTITGPNDARHIIWAYMSFFPFSFCVYYTNWCFIYCI